MQLQKIRAIGNFELGRAVGRYWGDFFGRRRRRASFKDMYHRYKDYLVADTVETDRLFLMNNIATSFPELMSEMIGMTVGINESDIGFKATLPGLFGCCLAESDYSTHKQYVRCSEDMTRLLTERGLICIDKGGNEPDHGRLR